MEEFITLVLAVFGVLQIILFFKIWIMTNDVRKILRQIPNKSGLGYSEAQKEEIDAITDLLLKTKGKEAAKNYLMDAFISNEATRKFIYGAFYEKPESRKFIEMRFSDAFAMLGEYVPEIYVTKTKDASHSDNGW